MIGRTLGHYEIVEKLGEGGMGAVYRARDTTLGRDVALKLLPEFVSGDSERIARLEREARLLASLSHPNIATLHGLEESNGQKFLVMELVPGETLAERIARGPLRLEECLGVFQQIAEGLEAAHEKGVIHRDLKPANVVVTPEGRVKILDFGLAKAVAEEAPTSDLSKSPTLTREGTERGVILGTASYMSPEQARGKTLDRRTDIWSFGCVFYEALTGRKAFPGETVSDILAAILEREPDWTALPGSTPAEIRDLLEWCLHKDLNRRLRDIADARIEVDAPSGPPISMPRRRYLPWAVAAVVSGVAVWSLLRPREQPERAVSRFTLNLPPEQSLTWRNDPSVAISPDGRYLIYVGGLGNNRKLYLRPIDQLESRAIPGTDGAETAFFSPDGGWVGFYTGPGRLEKKRLDSGPVMTLFDALVSVDPSGASWGPGGTILFAQHFLSGLSRVSASGGTPSAITSPDAKRGETGHVRPEILPDGKTALFTILTAQGNPRIGHLSLDTGKYRVLVEEGFCARYVPTGHLVYAKGATLMGVPFDLERLQVTGKPVSLVEGVWTNPAYGTAHFAFSQDGTLTYVPDSTQERTLVWVDRTGAARPMRGVRRAYYEDPRLSPDGRRLAMTVRDEGLRIWVYDLKIGAFMQLTFGPKDEQAPLWTPDGKRLAFRRGIASNLFWLSADGSGQEERLTTSEYLQRPDSWSPDGSVLIYAEETPSANWDIFFIELDSRRMNPFLQTPFAERNGILSPDGRYIAFISDESGRFEVYVRAFPSSEGKWRISTDGGRQPVWARDGREIFYRDGDKMMAVPVETGALFQMGKPAVLFEAPFSDPDYASAQYDVSPDGEHFVMIQEAGPTQIHVVQNWFEELKEHVPTRPR